MFIVLSDVIQYSFISRLLFILKQNYLVRSEAVHFAHNSIENLDVIAFLTQRTGTTISNTQYSGFA